MPAYDYKCKSCENIFEQFRTIAKRNEPAYVRETLIKLAEIKQLSQDEVDKITTDNFFSLFNKATL